jgi:hypothetical protein
MSEPNQLYMKVKIGRPQLEKFFEAKGVPVSTFPDTAEWISTKQYYGEPLTFERIEQYSPVSYSAGDAVSVWTSKRDYPLSTNTYDEETQTWTLAILEFSENYGDFIRMMTCLRRIADFKDIDTVDHLLIYGYIYEDCEVAAAIEITLGASRILTGAPSASLISEANAVMDDLLTRNQEKFKD